MQTVRPLNAPTPRRRRERQRGVSLVEVMVAMTLLAVLAGALTASVLYARRLAEHAVYQASVHTAIAGYLEQVKVLPYATLAQADLPTLPTAITSGQWNVPPPIDINRTPSLVSDDIVFRIRPRLTNLQTDGTAPLNGLQCYEIVLDYEYDTRLFGALRTYRGSLRLVRSFVPTF